MDWPPGLGLRQSPGALPNAQAECAQPRYAASSPRAKAVEDNRTPRRFARKLAQGLTNGSGPHLARF